MSDQQYYTYLAIACALIVGFVFAFLKRPAARFLIALILFCVAAFGLYLLQGRMHDEAFQASEQRERAKFEEWKKDFDSRYPATPAPAGSTLAPMATPALIFIGPVRQRATPTAAEQNAEIARKYGTPK